MQGVLAYGVQHIGTKESSVDASDTITERRVAGVAPGPVYHVEFSIVAICDRRTTSPCSGMNKRKKRCSQREITEKID
jgi:hypothetical protein